VINEKRLPLANIILLNLTAYLRCSSLYNLSRPTTHWDRIVSELRRLRLPNINECMTIIENTGR